MDSKVYEDSLHGLQVKYERGFKSLVEPELSKEDILNVSYDPVDGQNRSNLFKFLRAEYNKFQEPYVAAGYELGKSFYLMQRAEQENKKKTQFGFFDGVALTSSLLNENVTPYWTMTGLLKKVLEEGATLDWAASVGSKGVADLSRNASVVNANADVKTLKMQSIRLSTGACEFCRLIAKNHEDNMGSYVTKFSKVKMHSNCNCSMSYHFYDMSTRYYNSLSDSQQRRIRHILSEQKKAEK